MIESIKTCITDTCIAIGLDSSAVFSVSETPDIIAYDPSAQYEILNSTHNAINPWIERKQISSTECCTIKLVAEVGVFIRISFISVSETTLETLAVQFVQELPREFAWDEYMNIVSHIGESTREDYIEVSGDPVDYKELRMQLRFNSMIYETETETIIKNISIVPASYTTG